MNYHRFGETRHHVSLASQFYIVLTDFTFIKANNEQVWEYSALEECIRLEYAINRGPIILVSSIIGSL